jgi:hypothetical protein
LSKPVTYALACFALAAGICGCGNSSPQPPSNLQQGLSTDSAYLAVLEAQNLNAQLYSTAVLKTTRDSRIRAFAKIVVAERAKERPAFATLRSRGAGGAIPTLPAAAKTLGLPLRSLAVNADGTPLAAPKSDAAYVKAMTANDQAVVAASQKENLNGSAVVLPFAKNVFLERSSELKTLSGL